MQDLISQVGDLAGIEVDHTTSAVMIFGIIFPTAAVMHIILHWVALRAPEKRAIASSRFWLQTITQNKLFHRLAFTLQGTIVNIQAVFWLQKGTEAVGVLITCAQLQIMTYALFSVFPLLDVILNLAQKSLAASQLPLKGIFQGIKLIGTILVDILMIPPLIGQSPTILISGLGAMAAVLMLAPKDPTLGLVADTQFSANDTLKLGDWLEMSKYGADDAVIDIGLTTVKMRNWDNITTTILTWSLVSDSFKNWSGMSASGGRRIKRSISIDITSTRFLDEDGMRRLNKTHPLKPYLTSHHQGTNEWSRRQGSAGSILDLRRMTDIGTFCAYLNEYLCNHPWIRKDMTLMIHQLAPGDNGLPLEIYAFTNTVVWLEYESIQAGIFDHTLAIVEEFGLRPHQSLTGNDIRSLVGVFKQ